MEGAVNNGVEGIEAECGGACSCATCHCYVRDGWWDKLPQMDVIEDSMLEAATERRSNSRPDVPDRRDGGTRRADRGGGAGLLTRIS